jgi:hypothetical protein
MIIVPARISDVLAPEFLQADLRPPFVESDLMRATPKRMSKLATLLIVPLLCGL